MHQFLHPQGFVFFVLPGGLCQPMPYRALWTTILCYYSCGIIHWNTYEKQRWRQEFKGGFWNEKICLFFGVFLAELILRHTDNLSKTLQTPWISAVVGQKITAMTWQSKHCSVFAQMKTSICSGKGWKILPSMKRRWCRIASPSQTFCSIWCRIHSNISCYSGGPLSANILPSTRDDHFMCNW